MREIKFRCWQGEEGIFYHFNSLSEIYEEGSIGGYADFDWCQQYTGLKDKNGVEVYEGDVVTAHQFLFNGSEVESQIFGEISIDEFGVTLKRIKNEFYEEYTGYEPYEGECYLFSFYGLHEESFEVIGNIYQNPELLEE